jgi:hypothetical protein
MGAWPTSWHLSSPPLVLSPTASLVDGTRCPPWTAFRVATGTAMAGSQCEGGVSGRATDRASAAAARSFRSCTRQARLELSAPPQTRAISLFSRTSPQEQKLSTTRFHVTASIGPLPSRPLPQSHTSDVLSSRSPCVASDAAPARRYFAALSPAEPSCRLTRPPTATDRRTCRCALACSASRLRQNLLQFPTQVILDVAGHLQAFRPRGNPLGSRNRQITNDLFQLGNRVWRDAELPQTHPD